MSADHGDIAIVGAGASGLWAAIEAARSAPGRRIVLLERARRPGAKILVSGGGRCNIGNRRVTAADYCGSSPAAIRRVLAGQPASESMARFEALGLPLVEEQEGRLYPASQRASSVLEALLGAVARAGVELRCSWEVTRIERLEGGFLLHGESGRLQAARLLLAAGGCSLPRSGSDGSGHRLARALGHRLSSPIVPALSALRLPAGHRLTELAGLSQVCALRMDIGDVPPLRGKGSMLCTHFGLSGPLILDCSRHWLMARARGLGARCQVDWLPACAAGESEAELRRSSGGRRLLRAGEAWLSERLRRALLELAGLPADLALAQVTRGQRQRLLEIWHRTELPLEGARDWHHAETTAGGVPLAETDPATLASRRCPRLLLCGEGLDVDGRLGGFNFQWAWSSGAVAGRAAATLPDSYFDAVAQLDKDRR
jgi:predicted Rossmann fold flavoprotein